MAYDRRHFISIFVSMVSQEEKKRDKGDAISVCDLRVSSRQTTVVMVVVVGGKVRESLGGSQTVQQYLVEQ